MGGVSGEGYSDGGAVFWLLDGIKDKKGRDRERGGGSSGKADAEISR